MTAANIAALHAVDGDGRPESVAFEVSEYRSVLHWPVDGDSLGAYLEVGPEVGALRMRAGLGAEVQWWLRLRMLAGPVLAVPGKRTEWTFLTQPATDDQRRRPLPPGVEPVTARVLLPTPDTDRSVTHWATAPDLAHPSLPLFSSVVGAVRSVLYGHRF
ncbi:MULTISPECIES: hypothetical protein [Actinokineospora]|uniref:Uncharacterized protein n=1 Tax=Actinokineospora fastidiosa TaxID=1816 RepID=A0A918GGT1_9PSEU|nr:MULTISPECIES: hypothetical protein [Actinokineospora]UVS80739.1 hypothetical protein Actkin_04491 [Actinokineospora sp. UTMC 2448]GGS36794.1 hypothetical protein GCM10010171_34550 [Actinokineospora fastidiosa]